MPTDWQCWQSQARSTGLVPNRTALRVSASFAGPVPNYARLFYSPMNLPLSCCVNTSRELTIIVSSAPPRQQLRLTDRRGLRSANSLNATEAYGEGSPQGATGRSNAWLRSTPGAARPYALPADARSRKCFSRHFGPG